jgi:hypothetical protein
MVGYWKYLYKPKAEGESELDTLSRRLSFKLPIVVRFNVGLALFLGVAHSIFANNSKWIIRYFYLSPLWFAFVCHQEIIKYLQIKNVLQRPMPTTRPSQPQLN